MSALVIEEGAVAAVVVGGVAWAWLSAIGKEARHERSVLKERVRARRARYAAIEAAEDDPSFSPEMIERSVTEVVALADALWRHRGANMIGSRPDSALIRAWARSRQSWLGGGLTTRGKPAIDLLRVVNRDNEEEDRVTIRLRLRVHCRHPSLGLIATRYVRLDERWTLGRSGGRWVVLAMGGDPLGGPVLTAPLVPNPSFDTDRLREESLAELAKSEKVGADVDLGQLVDADEPPALALLDLSVVDGRFAPALVAATLARVLEAWEEAVTGSERPLEQLAGPKARAALLRAGPGRRLVMRDAVLKSWEPTGLHLSERPPSIEVAVEVEAVRYVVTDAGSYRAGNDTDAHRMALSWILELTDSDKAPWRLATSNNPAEAIPE